MYPTFLNVRTTAANSSDSWPLLDRWEKIHVFDAGSLLLNIVGIAIAGFALWVAFRQLRPLRRTLEEIALDQKRARRLRTSAKPPRKQIIIRGFDPRFDTGDWTRILGPHLQKRRTIRPRLFDRYREFYDWYDRRVHHGSDEILIIDLLLMPELLKREVIRPLNSLLPLNAMLATREDGYGTRLKKTTKDLLEYLCTDVNGQLGALPLWINTHGRFVRESATYRDDRPEVTETEFSEFLRSDRAGSLLAQAGVQTTYLSFEFWAHLAYHGGRIFTVKAVDRHEDEPHALPRGGELHCNLKTSSDDWLAFRSAVADLATRLRFSTLTKNKFMHATEAFHFQQEHAFRVGHLGEARMIRNGVAAWKPVFSSELLRKAMPRRDDEIAAQLSDESCFKPPYIKRHHNNRYTYLSALGGYGVALPTASSSNRNAVEALKMVFLANPCLSHPYLTDMLEDSNMPVKEFMERHTRPRVPFWREIEDELNKLLIKLMLKIIKISDAEMKPVAYWNLAMARLTEDDVRIAMREFISAIGLITLDNGWHYDDGISPRPQNPELPHAWWTEL